MVLAVGLEPTYPELEAPCIIHSAMPALQQILPAVRTRFDPFEQVPDDVQRAQIQVTVPTVLPDVPLVFSTLDALAVIRYVSWFRRPATVPLVAKSPHPDVQESSATSAPAVVLRATCSMPRRALTVRDTLPVLVHSTSLQAFATHSSR